MNRPGVARVFAGMPKSDVNVFVESESEPGTYTLAAGDVTVSIFQAKALGGEWCMHSGELDVKGAGFSLLSTTDRATAERYALAVAADLAKKRARRAKTAANELQAASTLRALAHRSESHL